MLFIDLFDIICFIFQIQHILREKQNRMGVRKSKWRQPVVNNKTISCTSFKAKNIISNIL